MNHIEKLRRTGRTTRMLLMAKTLAEQGRAVYVICAHTDTVRSRAIELGIRSDLGVKFETLASLRSFVLEQMRLLGAHPNCIVLVDHYVIERQYALMLEELHRYDAPTDSTKRDDG